MGRRRTGHLYKREGVYQLEYMVNGKRIKKSLKTKTQKDALIERDRIMKPLEVGDEESALRVVAHRLSDATSSRKQLERDLAAVALSDAWQEYEAARNRPDSGDVTLRGYKAQWARFLKWVQAEHAGIQYMHMITSTHAEAYATDLAKSGITPNTFNKHINLLQLVFKVLKKRAAIENNPWEDIERKRLRTNSRRELTTEELIQVCNSAEGELRTLFAIGIYTGLRLGDCATLRWSETDLIRGIIRRIPNKTARRSGTVVQIPIHRDLLTTLRDRKLDAKDEYVLPEMATLYSKDSSEVTTKIQAHFKACGIRVHREGTGQHRDSTGELEKTGKRAVVEVGFHSMRHSFVSLCRENEAPLAVVEAIVGHATPAMTRHYTHIGAEASAKAIASLPSLTIGAEKQPEENSVVTALKSMNGKNWRKMRDDLIEQLERAT